jgi:triosephosphate isomerase
VVFPPFPFIRDVYLESETKVSVGAQACYVEDKGAYTGAISPLMLKSIGCKYVLVGHSERRKVN